MSPKWCAGAACDTPARRARSRRLRLGRAGLGNGVDRRRQDRLAQVAVVVGAGRRLRPPSDDLAIDKLAFEVHLVSDKTVS